MVQVDLEAALGELVDVGDEALVVDLHDALVGLPQGGEGDQQVPAALQRLHAVLQLQQEAAEGLEHVAVLLLQVAAVLLLVEVQLPRVTGHELVVRRLDQLRQDQRQVVVRRVALRDLEQPQERLVALHHLAEILLLQRHDD